MFKDVEFVIGYNRSTLVSNESFPVENFGNINHYYNGNVYFGVTSEIFPSYHIGMTYIKRGTRETQNVEDLYNYPDGDQMYTDVKIENIHILNYLSISGYKAYNISNSFSIQGGVYCDLYLDGKIKVKEDWYVEYYYNDSGYIETYSEILEDTIEFYDMYLKEPNSIDIGFQIGLDINLTNHISANAIYQYGFLEAHEISYEGSDYKNGWKNRSINFQLNMDLINMIAKK